MDRCNFCDGDNYEVTEEGKKVEPQGSSNLVFIPCSCEEGFNKGQFEDPGLSGEGFNLDDRYDDPWNETSTIDVWQHALGEEDSEDLDPYGF